MAGCGSIMFIEKKKKINHNSTFCMHCLRSQKITKKCLFFSLLIFPSSFKAVNGYLIDNNNNQKEKNESFDDIENQIMVYNDLNTLHLHYELEKPGYQG